MTRAYHAKLQYENLTSSETKKLEIPPPKLPPISVQFHRTVVTKFTEKFSHQYFNITHKTANPISRNSPTKAASERRKSDLAIRESCATLRQLQSMTDSCCSNRTEYRAVLGPRNIRTTSKTGHHSIHFACRHLLADSWTAIELVLQAEGGWFVYAKRWDSIYLKRMVGYVILL